MIGITQLSIRSAPGALGGAFNVQMSPEPKGGEVCQSKQRHKGALDETSHCTTLATSLRP